MPASQNSYTFDNDLELKDAGLVAATAAATVDAAAKQLDFGDTDVNGVENISYVPGHLVIDVDAMEFGSADEEYEVQYQLSDNVDFSAGTCVVKASVRFGLGVGLNVDNQADGAIGRTVIGVDNEFQGTLFRHARLATFVAGTIAAGINYRAFLSRL